MFRERSKQMSTEVPCYIGSMSLATNGDIPRNNACVEGFYMLRLKDKNLVHGLQIWLAETVVS